MSGSPRLKIFKADGEYVGCMKYAEDAACICASYGTDASIRDGHNKRHTVWVEGREDVPEGSGYDTAAKIIYERIEAIWAKVKAIA